MTRFLLLTAAFCIAFSAAVASDIHRWTDDCYVVIQPTTVVGAEAEVVFSNVSIHPLAEETFELTLGDLTVTVLFERDVQGTDDRFTVTPPPGFVAIPPELIVPENAAGRIVIYEGGIG